MQKNRFLNYSVISVLKTAYFRFLLAAAIIIISGPSNLFAYFQNDSDTTDIWKKSVLAKDTTEQVNKIHPGDNSGPVDTFPSQDSAYARAMRLRIPEHSRFQNGIRLFASGWRLIRSQQDNNPWVQANRNLDLPSDVFMPRGEEIVMHDYNIQNSLAVPFMQATNPYGLKVPFATIGNFLGITEDVSPIIPYTLEFTSKVEIKIYSVSAKEICTVYKGVEQPGSHKKTWNGRDEYGRPVPRGDYIAEVLIGGRKFITKRIYIATTKHR